MKSLLWRIVPLVVWVIVVTALGNQLTVAAATAAGVAGCVAAFWVGSRLAASKVRLWVPWACALPIQAVIFAISAAIRGTEIIAQTVGPAEAWVLSSVVLWFGSAALWVGLFQASSRRVPPFVALEAAAVTIVGASIFAHHREGSINRPFFLVDPLWAKGYDPLPVFLAIGGVVSAVLILLMASKSAAASRRTTFLEVTVLMVAMLLLYAVFPTHQLPKLRDMYNGQGGDKKTSASPSPASGQDGGASPSPRRRASGHGQGHDDGMGTDSEIRDDDFSKKKSSGAGAQPVAVVLFHDDYTPPDGFYYFRQAVFSTFNGQRVVRDDGTYDRDVADGFPTDKALTMTKPRAERSVARTLKTTVALITSHARPFGLVGPLRFEAENNPDPNHFQRAYRVESDVLTTGLPELLDHGVGDPSWTKETREHYLAAPTDPRYKAIADGCLQMLRAELRDKPLARAVAIKLWLDQNGTYDLTSKYENSKDPVGDFLFGDRVGYCVSFAHAAVALYRTVGVPARVGTGYAVDSRFRGQSSALLIRSNASHAWPEIYLEGVGWVPLDISPAKSLVKPADPPDSGQQDLYGDLARKKGEKRRPDQPEQRINLQDVMRGLLSGAFKGLLGGLGLLVLVMYAMKIWRRIEPGFARDADLPLVAYRSALSVLADHGRVRGYGQSREQFARDLEDVCPSLTPLTRIHLRHALGPQDALPARDDLLSLRRAVGAEIESRSRPARRAFALLHPFGWWLVR